DALLVSHADLNVVLFAERAPGEQFAALDKRAANRVESLKSLLRPKDVHRVDNGTIQVAQENLAMFLDAPIRRHWRMGVLRGLFENLVSLANDRQELCVEQIQAITQINDRPDDRGI